MTMPITLRPDSSADELRRLARRSRDANQARRLLALAAIDDGARRDKAARIGGVGRQIIRDWVLRFSAVGPDGLIDRKSLGPARRLNDAHAVLLFDQAGCHVAGALNVPDVIPLLPLPAKCPELNPQENVWQFLRDNWLSNLIFTSYDNIVDQCCDAWNRLTDEPWRIMSLGLRDWAHGL